MRVTDGQRRGPKNSLTDVEGVRVGHVTLISGEGPLVPGRGPVRTGVTAILPPDDVFTTKCAAGAHVINGVGKMTGIAQVQELGRLETPIVLTNTFSVWQAADGLLDYVFGHAATSGVAVRSCNPVVGECNDSRLNDMQGRHVRAKHVVDALEQATDAPVPQGAVGAGTGMICYGFKGGIGSASREWRSPLLDRTVTVGALVLANFGRRDELTVDGCPVGKLLGDPDGREDATAQAGTGAAGHDGSVIVILATDAPLTSRQLTRVARRAASGLARTGSPCHHGSGDFALAFSTARAYPAYLPDEGALLDPFFAAAADTTEEAVIRALLFAHPMVGRDEYRVDALSEAQVRRACADWHRRAAEAAPGTA